MSRLYLITGFLGAGKTTFLKHLVPLFPAERVALLVNEFGREGVDGALLSPLGLTLTEIHSGSIFCACRAEEFQQALAALAAQGPGVILVEASGLSDPSQVGTLLAQPQFSGISYAGALCLVDAARFHKVYATARVCKKQLAIADVVIVNKTDLATPEQLAALRREVAALRPGVPVFETTFGRISPQWLCQLSAPQRQAGTPILHTKDLTLQTLTLSLSGLGLAEARHFLALFCEDTYRVKGFLRLPEGLYLVDCVGPLVRVTPWAEAAAHENHLTVLFGNGLPARKSLAEAAAFYPGATITIS